MARNTRKIIQEIDKNFKLMEEVLTTLFLFITSILDNRSSQLTRIEALECTNAWTEGKSGVRNEERD